MTETSIEWCDWSSNPLKYRNTETGKVEWGCVKASAGCANCYSELLAKRWNRGGPFSLQQMRKLEPFLDEKELALLLRSKKLTGKKVFVGDMTDLFGPWVPFDLLDKLFAVFALRPDVTWQVLTKRPERMAEYFTRRVEDDEGWPVGSGAWDGIGRVLRSWQQGDCDWLNKMDVWSEADGLMLARHLTDPITLPLSNVWLGTSLENQQAASERIPHLLRCPAAVRFLSCEPLLGYVELIGYRYEEGDYPYRGHFGCAECAGTGYFQVDPYTVACRECRQSPVAFRGTGLGIHWVIVGCESNGPRVGRNAERANDHIADVVGQCREAGVPVFVKQIAGERGRVEHDINKFPAELRYREFPQAVEVQP